MKRNQQVALVALLGGAVVYRLFRGRRRGHGRPEPDDEALAGAAQQAAADQAVLRDGVEVVVPPQPVSAAKPWATFISETLQPYAYLRLAQVFLALLTVVGSAINGMTFSKAEPIVGIILTMGVVHISALEAILQTLGRPKVRPRAATVIEVPHAPEVPPAVAVHPAAAADAVLPLADAAAVADAAAAADAAAVAVIPKAITDVLPYTPDQINGMWIKDRKRSDDMSPVCDAMHMFGLLRQAIKILKGTRLCLSPEGFDVVGVSVIPLLKIVERYPLDGTEAKHRRRDQRGGGSWGRAEATPEGMLIQYRWGHPYPGTLRELFRLTAGGTEMHLEAEGVIEGAPVRFRMIHTRPGAPTAS
eukprot:jgi/Ulvmu1/8179/UM040_0076.1